MIMNESIDLTKILKDCSIGTKLYTPVWGEVLFRQVNNQNQIYPICIETRTGRIGLTKEGHYLNIIDADCVLFPSKDQRDWSKFTAPWYKKERFDPQTLNPFDKVLVSDVDGDIWHCNIFEYIRECAYPYSCVYSSWERCIPYNDETKHLVGTTEEAPEYYRYWED